MKNKVDITNTFLMVAVGIAVLGIGYLLILDQPVLPQQVEKPKITDTVKNKATKIEFDQKKMKDSFKIMRRRRI